MNISVSTISSALKKALPVILAIMVAMFLVALLVRWAVMLTGPAAISHHNPLVMATAFATLYFGTGAYILRQQFIQMAGIIRQLALMEVHLSLPLFTQRKM